MSGIPVTVQIGTERRIVDIPVEDLTVNRLREGLGNSIASTVEVNGRSLSGLDELPIVAGVQRPLVQAWMIFDASKRPDSVKD